MSKDLMLKCLIAFILGWLLCRMMGNGFSVGASSTEPRLDDLNQKFEAKIDKMKDDLQTKLVYNKQDSDDKINNINNKLESLIMAMTKNGKNPAHKLE